MLRVVYFRSALTGVGRLVHGLAIGNALLRKGIQCKYTILHSSTLGHLADDFHQIRVHIENEKDLSLKNYQKTILFKTLKRLSPDILLVNHQWFMLHHFINELKCKKLYLSDQAYDSHFRIPLAEGEMVFDSGQYDRVIAIEPFDSAVPMEQINPLIIRNRDEILSKNDALKRLGLDGSKKIALYSFSLSPETYEKFLGKYAYLDNEYEVIRTSTFGRNLFPAVDYFNAFDLIVCGAGYNQVWEAVYFQKKTIFEPLQVNFSDQSVRIKTSKIFHFDINGAEQLVDIIMNM